MAVLVITIFFGYFGVYRFIKKQYVLGVVYIFTFGLFCVGYVIDIIKAYQDFKDSQKIENIDPNIMKNANEILNKYKSILNGTKIEINRCKSESTAVFTFIDNPKQIETFFYNPFFDKLPSKTPYALKKEHKQIDDEYKTLAQYRYLYFNMEQQFLGFMFFNDKHILVRSPRIMFAEIIDYEFNKDESVETDSSSVGVATIGTISTGSARTSSSTKTVFRSATLIIKTKNIKYPVVSIKIYNADNFREIKAYMETVIGK